MGIRVLKEVFHLLQTVYRGAAGAGVAAAVILLRNLVDMDKAGTETDPDGTIGIAIFDESRVPTQALACSRVRLNSCCMALSM